MDDAGLEKALLLAVSQGDVQSDAFAAQCGVDHKKVIGLMKSLEASELITSTAHDQSKLTLTAEAETYVTAGSPEAQAFAAVPVEGCTLAEFKAKVDKAVGEVGFKQAMQSKWLGMVKGPEPRVERKVEAVTEDPCKNFLAAIAAGNVAAVPQKELDNLVKKRKLVKEEKWKTYGIAKGAQFALERKKQPADLTLRDARGRLVARRDLQGLQPRARRRRSARGRSRPPLLKVRQQFRETFLQLGFAEMPTNNFVESGFGISTP